MTDQISFFDEIHRPPQKRYYGPILTVTENRKGVIDVDTVKGCTMGMNAYPDGGCYGECYAAKTAKRYGIDFTVSVSRQLCDREHRGTLVRQMLLSRAGWYRVGVAGDPCHDWRHTIAILRALRWTKKIPVVVTKHWVTLTDKQIDDLHWLLTVVNTSVSGLDTEAEIACRVKQRDRLRDAGVHSVLRVVTCNYGNSEWARIRKERQDYLLSLLPVIDNPLRARKSNPRVLCGDIVLTRKTESIGGGKYVSLHTSDVYLGTCKECPDRCGVGPPFTPKPGKGDQLCLLNKLNYSPRISNFSMSIAS